MAPLIGYVASGGTLTPAHRKFIAEALERLDGPRGKAEVRRLEKRLTRVFVEELISEGWKPEAAVHEIMRIRGYSRSYVYAALRSD
jgi:hypothetical protein